MKVSAVASSKADSVIVVIGALSRTLTIAEATELARQLTQAANASALVAALVAVSELLFSTEQSKTSPHSSR